MFLDLLSEEADLQRAGYANDHTPRVCVCACLKSILLLKMCHLAKM